MAPRQATTNQSTAAVAPARMRFAFWNLNRKSPSTHLRALAHDYDVLMFVEAQSVTHAALTAFVGTEFRVHSVANQPIRWAVRRSIGRLFPRDDTPHLSLGRLRTSGQEDLFIALVHLPSARSNYKSFDYGSCARAIMQSISRAEHRDGHRRTLVVGDFNMDPFHAAMLQADGFHALMSRDLVRRPSRIVQRTEHWKFYNPMWRLLANGSAPASYFWGKGAYVAYYWHMFDQVLVRPALLPRFDDHAVEILTTTSAGSLLKNDRPNRDISDHLPLRFELGFTP